MGGLAPFYPNGGTVGGESSLLDVSSRSCLIYELGLESPEVYVHELAHVMGCLHSFEDKATMNSIERGISDHEGRLYHYSDYVKEKTELLRTHGSRLSQTAHNQLSGYINSALGEAKMHLTKIEQLEHLMRSNAFSFQNLKQSSNFMDYTSKGRLDFFRWQWLTLQDDVLNYYT